MSAHECQRPVLTLTTVVAGVSPVMPETGTGTRLLLLFQAEFPQHFAVPSAITAHE
jgi:hypothetical protein